MRRADGWRPMRVLICVWFALGLGITVFPGCGSDRPSAAEGAGIHGQTTVRVGPCGPEQEGKSIPCHVETGRTGSFVNCFSGVQVCHDGVWGACGGPDGTLRGLSLGSIGASSHGGGLRVLSGSPTASGCAANPCNPYCLGEDVDAGALTPGSFTSTSILGTITTPEGFPGSASGPKNSMGPSWNNTTKTWACSNAGIGAPPTGVPAGTQDGHPPSNYRTCSSDYCCASSGAEANTCQPWVVASGDNPAAESCIKTTGSGSAGIDFTVGLSCTDTGGHVHVPVCNRGTNDATSGILMFASYPGNPNYAGTAAVCDKPGSPSDTCKIDLATKPIPAGKCIDIDGANAFAGSVPGVTCNSNLTGGNAAMMINPPNTTGYTPLAEGDYCNNYGFRRSSAATGTCSLYGVQPPPPASATNTYTATCKSGEVVQWNQLTYSVTPNTGVAGQDYNVGFTLTTSNGVTKTIYAKNTTNYPGNCAINTVTQPACTASPPADSPCNTPAVAPSTAKTCPTDLFTLLGPTGASASSITLSLAIAPGATTSPTVHGWSISYNCVPKE